ncbi:MAG TPA: hypothetical protein VD902_21800 [Symbiobacteriaceae bacterium]|nr:hypothetical protein [Symbiobacteriaceae bacterium]
MELNEKQRMILGLLARQTEPMSIPAVGVALTVVVSLRDVEPMVEAGLLVEAERPKVAGTSDAKALHPRRFSISAQGAEIAQEFPAPTVNAVGPTEEQYAEMRRRFEAGAGGDTESQLVIAQKVGVSVISVCGEYKRWQASKAAQAVQQVEAGPVVTPEPERTQAATEAPEPITEPATPARSVEIPPGRITGEKRDLLYARFAAGEGTTKASRAVLAQQFGCAHHAILNHRSDWLRVQAALRKAEVAALPAATVVEQDPGGHEPTLAEREELLTEPDDSDVQAEAVLPHLWVPAKEPATGICVSCMKSDVCVWCGHSTSLVENRPSRAGVVQIRYGARPVEECTSYVEQRAAGD